MAIPQTNFQDMPQSHFTNSATSGYPLHVRHRAENANHKKQAGVFLHFSSSSPQWEQTGVKS